MQKINRKQLAKDVIDFDFSQDLKGFWDCRAKITVEEAHRLRGYAAILQKITDPEFVPTEKMKEAGYNTLEIGVATANKHGFKTGTQARIALFRAMIGGIVK
jgi:hypothetical protein